MTDVLGIMATTVVLLSVLAVLVGAAQKSDRRQDYFDYGDGGYLSVTADDGAAGYAFADSFGTKEKDSFAAVYGAPESDEGEDDVYSAFAYDVGGDDYGDYDVDYEGSEKKEKKQKRDRKPEIRRKGAAGPLKAAETKMQGRR